MENLASFKRHIPKNQEWILDNCIFLCRGGSWLYGTSHEASDEDYVGVTVAPFKYWLGLQNFEQFKLDARDENGQGVEATIYDIRKFCKLAMGSNPNIIEMLFVDRFDKNVITYNSVWALLTNMRNDLISERVRNTFCGFSRSQLMKLINKQNNKTGRQDLVLEHGFDTKFAMHCHRIIDQGMELLTTGQITFPRPNASELLEIRHGIKWNKDSQQDCLDTLQKKHDLLDATENLKLNSKPNMEKIEYYLKFVFETYVYPKDQSV